jgi:hypothetical protein
MWAFAKESLLPEKTIIREDAELVHITDSPEEAVSYREER